MALIQVTLTVTYVTKRFCVAIWIKKVNLLRLPANHLQSKQSGAHDEYQKENETAERESASHSLHSLQQHSEPEVIVIYQYSIN